MDPSNLDVTEVDCSNCSREYIFYVALIHSHKNRGTCSGMFIRPLFMTARLFQGMKFPTQVGLAGFREHSGCYVCEGNLGASVFSWVLPANLHFHEFPRAAGAEHNNVEGSTQQRFRLSQFWRLSVGNQGAGRALCPLKPLGRGPF